MSKLKSFVEHLARLDIKVELVGNYPWVYLDKINGVKVTEKFRGNHGFTIAFEPVKRGKKLHLTDIPEIFKLIRKYVENQSDLVDIKVELTPMGVIKG